MTKKKLESLTDEQVNLMEVVKNEWINLLDSCPRPNREAIMSGVKWLYSFSKLKEPLVIIVQSPFGAQIAANMLSRFLKNKAQVRDQVRAQVRAQVGDQVRDQVGAQVRDQVWDQVRAQVGDQVGDQVRDQVGAQVRDQVGAQVGDQVRDQVWAQVGAQVWDQKLEYFYFAGYCGGSLWDLGWLAFYDFFERIGIKHKVEAFASFRTLMQSGVYDMIQLDGVCIVIEMPTELSREQGRGRLHSTTGPAIKFGDGYEMYSLWGVRFPKDLFAKVTGGEITAKEVLKIENMEQRMAALRFRGAENLLIDLDAKLLNRSERGNELYFVKDVFSVPAYFLKYKDPSTERIYVSGVDPEIGIDGDADKAMAWKFNWSKEQYSELRNEA